VLDNPGLNSQNGISKVQEFEMTNPPIFKILTLLARPAAGKSEVMDYLKRTPIEERMQRFHVGEIAELDDFPMLWTWFEEDALLERMGHPRMHTDKEGYFLHQYQWDLLIDRICLDYQKLLRDKPDYHQTHTVLVEFSRGSEHGGYRSAFKHISTEVAQKMAVLYLDVSWEESLRKNRKRFNPKKPDSILEHGLEDAKLQKLYKEVDWRDVSAPDPNWLRVNGEKVPYVVFDNSDDITSPRGDALGQRLQGCLDRLWGTYSSK
jgi:hypothetical protein